MVKAVNGPRLRDLVTKIMVQIRVQVNDPETDQEVDYVLFGRRFVEVKQAVVSIQAKLDTDTQQRNGGQGALCQCHDFIADIVDGGVSFVKFEFPCVKRRGKVELSEMINGHPSQ